MLFNSISFAIFLPLVFFLYWKFFSKNKSSQNLLLLIASYTFYAFWDWRFLFLMFLSSLTDYLLGIQIEKSKTKNKRKLFLGISIFVNLGILCFFKYFNFFLDTLQNIGIESNSTLNIILPVGISFYTFQTMSYSIDIYRKELRATKDWVSFFTFVAFFPQLVAGPIERAKNMLPQLEKKRTFTYQEGVEGLRHILWGLFKKIVIADRLGEYVDLIYAQPQEYQGMSLLLANIFFGIQIYCDFSGYSNIAIGAAKLFGIRLMQNFKSPYFSFTLREFWQRWHISLSTWFRDYIYFPLGGKNDTKIRWSINILIVFFISGLWHGAGYTFILFGILHGLYYVAEQTFNMPKKNLLYAIFTFAYLILVWTFFRAKTIEDAIHISYYGFNFSLENFSLNIFSSPTEGIVYLLAMILFIVIDFMVKESSFPDFIRTKKVWARISIYYSLIISIFLLGQFEIKKAFIYFQF